MSTHIEIVPPSNVPSGLSLRTRLLLMKLKSGGYPTWLADSIIHVLTDSELGYSEEEIYQFLVFLTAFYEGDRFTDGNSTGR